MTDLRHYVCPVLLRVFDCEDARVFHSRHTGACHSSLEVGRLLPIRVLRMRPIRRRALIAASVLLVALPCSFARPAVAAPSTNRDVCEASLALEEHGPQSASGRQACHDAFVFGGMAEDMRNEVASLLSPAAQPSLDDLVLGTLIADAALVKSPEQPWPYLARCDIARRTGNADTLQECLKDLGRFGPNNPATKQALAFAAKRSSWGNWVLRILAIVVLFGSLAHGLLSRWRDRHRIPNNVAMALLVVGAWCLLSGLFGRVVRADFAKGKDHLSDFAIDDADPESSVPTPEQQSKQPLEFGYYIQDLLAKAQHAEKAGDKAAVVRFYSALTKATPTAYAPSKLCTAFQAVGDLPKAIAACRTAITRKGSTAEDYTRFVNIVLSTPGPLPPLEEKELEVVITHLGGELQLAAVTARLRCEVALRFDNTGALEACTAELAKLAPKDPKTVSFQWALALKKHDRTTALQLIDQARGVGMSSEGIAKMEAGTQQMTRRFRMRTGFVAIGAILAVMLFAFGFQRLQNRRQAPA